MTGCTALALSPHLDDAAFSCGGTLFSLARAGWRVVVATLFTRSVPAPSGFALACQLDKGLGPEVDYMALRRAEDREAMRALGAAFEHVDLPEAPHRGYQSAPALFGPFAAADTVAPALLTEVRRLLDTHAPALVLAPQAVGGHVDHVRMVDALLAAAPGGPVAWWTDFPYALRPDTPEKPFAARFEALPEAQVSLDAAALAARARGAEAYASQLGYQFGGTSGLAAKLAALGETERFRGAAPL